ncbi:MAG: ribonuclease P protein component, partial [Cyanobacteria bacterium REEB67]|nr:ribonuclease P protein component [Cyanobacteria bacterium REEB67]
MLPASERLRKTSVFQRAYSAKNSVNSGCVTLYVLLKRSKDSQKKPPSFNQKNQEKHLATCRPDHQAGSSDLKNLVEKRGWPHNSFPLVGFSISKKVLKSACKRNRAKRRVREAYREFRRTAEPE